MTDIVITEFMDDDATEVLRRSFSVHRDDDLWRRPDELMSLVGAARALIVRNRTQVTAGLLDAAPRLRAVGRLGVGLDNIDLQACEARRVAVLPAVGANAKSVAEYVVTTGAILRRAGVYLASSRVASGEWPRAIFSAGRELGGARLGLIGFGSIGQVTGTLAAGLGMVIAAHDDFLPPDDPAWSQAIRCTLDELLCSSDIVSLHCPLTPATRGLIGETELSRMKKGAVLINTARGGIVEEDALVAALKDGHLAGAALDVFDEEPLTADRAAQFAGVPGLILTPHIAGVTSESNRRISRLTVENVLRALG